MAMTVPTRTQWGWRNQQRIFAGVLLAPALILLVVTVGIPIVAGVVTSLQRVRLNMPQRNSNFVGLENYQRMLASPDFWHSVYVSVLYTAGSVALTYVLGFAAALLFSRGTRWSAIARVLTLLPWATPVVAGSLVWSIMFDYDAGVLNRIIHWLPGNLANVPWLIEPRISLWAVVLVDAWHTFPLAMVLLLAGIQGIPRELYEAAEVDGASTVQKFFSITLPCLAPVSNVTLLLLGVWAFRRFDVVYLLTRGGPGDSTTTLTMETFDRAFRYYDLSYSATLGVATLIISAVMAAFYLRTLRRQGAE
ncbi:MAG TPA: sugar ABC transporter permease [Devosiaceae bacterium]|jgi:multiple sugar transport system permease protein